MRWFRNHIRLGSRAALLALALQFVLTLGHVHGVAAGVAEKALTAWSDQSKVVAPQPAKPDRRSTGTAEFDCPICALIQMASTSAPAVAPALPLPALYVVVASSAPAEPAWTTSPHFPFQARGPPSV